MELHLAVAVVYDAHKAKTERRLTTSIPHQREAAVELFDPRPHTDASAANLMCLWADPFWSGLTVKAIEPVSSQAAVFHVRGTLRPESHHALRCNNSLKMHFFRVHPPALDGNIRRDFLYSTAIPLHRLGPNARGRCYGAFNYNRCDSSANPISGMRVAVTPIEPVRFHMAVSLLAIRSPDIGHHRRLNELTAWLSAALTRLCPPPHSCYVDMRAYCRNQNDTRLFQDIPAMQALPWTNLPLSLALYALCGALCVNECAPHAFVAHWLPAITTDPSLPQGLRLWLLRIVRHTVVCFAMSIEEGIYWPDMSLNVNVEDQPFPLSFMPAERVFAKDDCEGRTSQVQLMKLLLQCLHRRQTQIGRTALLAEVRALPSFVHLLGTLRPAYVEALLDGACALGRLIDEGALDVQTTIGNVRFNDPAPAVHTPQVLPLRSYGYNPRI
jgi:hypothetical protein